MAMRANRRGRKSLGQICAFGLVGACGFAIDLGLTLLLTQAFGVSPFLARPPAAAVAVVATFLLNRRFTFRASQAEAGARRVGSQFRRYLVAASLSQAVIYAGYSASLLAGAMAGLDPRGALLVTAATVVGAGLGAVVTFVVAKRYAFAPLRAGAQAPQAGA